MTVAGKRCKAALPDGGTVEAVIRGKLFQANGEHVVVGDRVMVEQHHGKWMVEAVDKRTNEFVRQGLRKERQVLFANVERVLILAALAEPRTKTASVDRFLLAALRGGIPAGLVLTKTDLDDRSVREMEIRALYAAFTLPVYPVCNQTGAGVAALAADLLQGVAAFVGNSGVGKTSLLNRLSPGLDLRVREVSSWSGKGTHTTTAALLVPYHDHAALIDTPGMKSFVPHDATAELLPQLFPDIAALAEQCRFRDCRHASEPDCAVNAAAAAGSLSPSRFQSYRRLLEVVSE